MATSDLRVASTLSAWIAQATERLHDTGSPSPRVEAERLAAHVLGVSWSDLWFRMTDEIDPALFAGALSRRLDGEPLAYIEGSVVFYGREIECGPGVLVPRPETETLVDVALELIAGVHEPTVCDVGTGTGAIAIAIATQRPDAEVCATDISRSALAWAERNIAAHAVDIELMHGYLPRRGFDLVVSNPPYIPDGTQLPVEAGAEPPEALFAGPRGDEMLVRLAADAAAHNAMAVEVGTPDQAGTMVSLLSQHGSTGVRLDHTDRVRVAWMRRRRST